MDRIFEMLTYPLTLARVKGKAFGTTNGINATREGILYVGFKPCKGKMCWTMNGALWVWKREFLYVAGQEISCGENILLVRDGTEMLSYPFENA